MQATSFSQQKHSSIIVSVFCLRPKLIYSDFQLLALKKHTLNPKPISLCKKMYINILYVRAWIQFNNFGIGKKKIYI